MVPIYIDGLYQPFVVGGIFELTDVAQVEVLKGPQGTLLGRNATAGAINIVTRRPTVAPSLEVSAGYGSFNKRRFTGYATGGDGPVAASISGQYLQDDGFVRDVNTRRRTAALKDVSGRAKLLITPDEATAITLTASRDERDDTTTVGYAFRGNTVVRSSDPAVGFATSGRKVSLTFPSELEIKQTAVGATIVRQLGFADATWITGYADNSLHYRSDIDLSPTPLFVQDSFQYDHGVSEDVFLSSHGEGTFRWTVGAF